MAIGALFEMMPQIAMWNSNFLITENPKLKMVGFQSFISAETYFYVFTPSDYLSSDISATIIYAFQLLHCSTFR